MLFSPYLLTKTTRRSWPSADKGINIPSLSCLRSISTLHPSVIIGMIGTQSPFLSPRRYTVHYDDDIMLIRLSEQEIAYTLDLLVRLNVKKWKINTTKIQGHRFINFNKCTTLGDFNNRQAYACGGHMNVNLKLL